MENKNKLYKYSDDKMAKLTFFISKHHYNKIKDIAAKLSMPVSRVVCMGLDNELERENPCEYDLTLPEIDENLENAYADEGGKFLTFMKTLHSGMGLDMLVMLRYEMGVPNKTALITVFADCLEKGIIERYKPPYKVGRPEFPEDYFYYRMKRDKKTDTTKKKNKRELDYERYLILKRKFKGEE